MPEPRHLPRAPITEALFDIRVKANPHFQVDQFEDLRPDLEERFPAVQERRGSRFTFQFDPRAKPETAIEDLGVQGYFFRSEEEQLLAQFRVDGFTLNKLAPYTDWDHLFPIALDLWQKYVSVAQPHSITRQALRYINHIKPPHGRVDFDEYLRAAPQVPPELPQSLGAFFYRATIVDMEQDLASHVVQAFDPKASGDGITIILDIDCYKNVDILPQDESDFLRNFSDLRQFKNRVFFNYVTEKTLEMYE